MSAIDLILLGLLLDRPRNAYELARLVSERQIWRFLKISAPAIYKTCKRLKSRGWLSGKIQRKGELPEKVVYTVTPQGKDAFLELMEHFSSDVTPYYLNFNAFLWNIEKLDRRRAVKQLDNLRRALADLKAWVIQHERKASPTLSFAARAIVRQYRLTIGILADWSEETLEEYKRIKG